jgi:hypothetical protein
MAGNHHDLRITWSGRGWSHRGASDAQTKAEAMRIQYSIHFHVWDPNAWLEFLSLANHYLDGSFDVLLFEQNDTEVICVLLRNT